MLNVICGRLSQETKDGGPRLYSRDLAEQVDRVGHDSSQNASIGEVLSDYHKRMRKHPRASNAS